MKSNSYIDQPLSPLPREMCIEGSKVMQLGVEIGVWHPEQARFQWNWEKLGVDSSLLTDAEAEGCLWDRWAGAETTQYDYTSKSAELRYCVSGWLKRYPNLGNAARQARIEINVMGKRLLDIGGSGKDLVYWLRDRPARVDQVEVSPQSQLLCRKRVTVFCQQHNLPEPPIFYHTIPAENLPFANESFDFIFSRSTLHHCVRADVFAQIVRVLKPGGILLFSEPYLSGWLYSLMRLRRYVLKKDRGTDNPLRSHEIEMLAGLLIQGSQTQHAVVYSHSVFSNYLGGKDESFNPTGARHSAMHVAFIARKSEQ